MRDFVRTFRDRVIVPTLEILEEYDPGIHTDAAVDLLLGTAAVGSNLLYARSPGPVTMSLFALDPEVVDDVWSSLAHSQRTGIAKCSWESRLPAEYEWNPRVACAFARYVYRLVPFSLPNTVGTAASYWKNHYAPPNAQVTDYILSWTRYAE